MNAPTTGPWLVDPKRSLRVMNKDGVTVCSVGADDTQRDSWEANAVLIAAAPTMLDALKATGQAFRNEDSFEYTASQHDSIDLVHAALKKARGES